MKKKDQDGDALATKGDVELLRKDFQNDLELLGGNLAFQIDELRQETNKGFQRHEGILESILSVVTSISGQLKEMKNHGEKIESHEERITAAEVQIRMLQG